MERQQYNLKRPVEQIEKEEKILEAIKEQRGYRPSINDLYTEGLTLLEKKVFEGVEDAERVS